LEGKARRASWQLCIFQGQRYNEGNDAPDGMKALMTQAVTRGNKRRALI
jgi:hypothetical protein